MGDSGVQPYSELRPEIRVDLAGGHCGLRDIWSHTLECKETRITQRWIEKTLMLISYSFRGKSFCLISVFS